MKNRHLPFDWHYIGQKKGEDQNIYLVSLGLDLTNSFMNFLTNIFDEYFDECFDKFFDLHIIF